MKLAYVPGGEYGGYIGLGGDIPPAPTDVAIVAPATTGGETFGIPGPQILPKPPGGGYPNAPPPIVPVNITPPVLKMPCAKCATLGGQPVGGGITPGVAPLPDSAPVGFTPAPMPTLPLGGQRDALDSTTVAVGESSPAKPFPWWWLAVAFGVGYLARR